MMLASGLQNESVYGATNFATSKEYSTHGGNHASGAPTLLSGAIRLRRVRAREVVGKLLGILCLSVLKIVTNSQIQINNTHNLVPSKTIF